MNIRAIAFTEKGQGWQEKLGFPVTRGVPVMQWAREAFADADALLFIGACGIAVRAIAPLCRDKAADPGVLVMDEMGRHIIPILSGHIGGANDLALLLAERTGAEPVLTTATDVRGVPAIDSWAMKNDCAIENKAAIQAVSAAALAGKSVGVAITEREIRPPFPVTLFLRPRTLTLGVGCKRGTDAAHLEDCFRAFLHENGVSPLSVRAVATIDVKKDEAAILALCEKYRFPLQTYSAAELNAVPGVFAHSDFVMKTVGCGCVCERAAVMTGGRDARAGRGGKRMIQVVGIGPGRREGRTIAADDALRRAEVIVGYTTYVELVRDEFAEKRFVTTGMRGEKERCVQALLLSREGRRVALICSGDAQVYGMASLLLGMAEEGDEIEVVPGVTAALSAAAVLGSPLCGDFAVVSLSDQLTPWATIERRLRAAAAGGFPIALYNPCSRHRPDHLARACAILMETLPASTVCGYVQNIGRDGQKSRVLTLGELVHEPLDMFTTVLIGNAETQERFGRMLTPRGYRL